MGNADALGGSPDVKPDAMRPTVEAVAWRVGGMVTREAALAMVIAATGHSGESLTGYSMLPNYELGYMFYLTPPNIGRASEAAADGDPLGVSGPKENAR